MKKATGGTLRKTHGKGKAAEAPPAEGGASEQPDPQEAEATSDSDGEPPNKRQMVEPTGAKQS